MISHWFSLTMRNEYVVTGASGSFTCIQCQAGTYSTGIGAYFDLSCTYAHNLSSICTWFCLASQCKATLGFPKVSLHCAWVWFCSLLLIISCLVVQPDLDLSLIYSLQWQFNLVWTCLWSYLEGYPFTFVLGGRSENEPDKRPTWLACKTFNSHIYNIYWTPFAVL